MVDGSGRDFAPGGWWMRRIRAAARYPPVMADPVDPARCPLCGEANQCARPFGDWACGDGACGNATGSTGAPTRDCWCFRVTIPQEVLDRIPAPARGVACICTRCAGKAPGPKVSG